MLKTQNFSVQDFENINLKNYQQRTNESHILHSLEWMKIVKKTLGVNYKIALLRENNLIVASIPFVLYHNLIKGQSALPLQFSHYYGSIVADNDDVKKKILIKFFKYCRESNFFTQIPEVNLIKGHKYFSGGIFFPSSFGTALSGLNIIYFSRNVIYFSLIRPSYNIIQP